MVPREEVENIPEKGLDWQGNVIEENPINRWSGKPSGFHPMTWYVYTVTTRVDSGD